MALTKYAATEVLSVEVGVEGTRTQRRLTAKATGLGATGKVIFNKTAHRHPFEYVKRPGYLYVRSRAISSRCNDNHDAFPAEEIKAAYRTFVGKPVFVNHRNEDHKRARGVCIDAALHEDTNPDGSPDTWAEVLMEVDAVRFPMLAKALLRKEIDRTSMGTDVAFSVCSFCGNKAETPLEYCRHIPAMKGKKITRTTAAGHKEEVLVYETCYGLKFFENSLLVEQPADPTAYFLGDIEEGGSAPVLAVTAKKSKDEYIAPSTTENPERYKGVSIKKDKNGYYVHTHRARGKSFPSPEAIPAAEIASIEATGSLPAVGSAHVAVFQGFRSHKMGEADGVEYHYRPQQGGDHGIEAHVGGQVAGGIYWDRRTKRVGFINVEPEHQRKGIASNLWAMGKRMPAGHRPQHDPGGQFPDGAAWAKAVDSGQVRGQQALPHVASLPEPGEEWMPTKRIFGPTHGLDHRLFDAKGSLRHEVTDYILGVQDRFWGPMYPSWKSWSMVYFAGSEASEWTSPTLEGNNDFDILIGVDYDKARAMELVLARLTNEEMTSRFNSEFRATLLPITKDAQIIVDGQVTGPWDHTVYVNKDSYDIRKINPYAAWNVTTGTWAVKPPHLPDWSPTKFPEGQALWDECEAIADQIRAVLRLNEPYRTEQSTLLWDYLHSARSTAFTETGHGWLDAPNVIEKYLDQHPEHLWERLSDVRFKRTGLPDVAAAKLQPDAEIRPHIRAAQEQAEATGHDLKRWRPNGSTAEYGWKAECKGCGHDVTVAATPSWVKEQYGETRSHTTSWNPGIAEDECRRHIDIHRGVRVTDPHMQEMLRSGKATTAHVVDHLGMKGGLGKSWTGSEHVAQGYSKGRVLNLQGGGSPSAFDFDPQDHDDSDHTPVVLHARFNSRAQGKGYSPEHVAPHPEFEHEGEVNLHQHEKVEVTGAHAWVGGKWLPLQHPANLKVTAAADDDQDSLEGVKKAGYCADGWSTWQQGMCATYAHGLKRLNPKLKFGNVDGGQHWFAHDEHHAYDSAGRHPLPYHLIDGSGEESDLDQDPKEYGQPDEESGPEGPEPHIRSAMAHAKRNGILEGRYGPHAGGLHGHQGGLVVEAQRQMMPVAQLVKWADPEIDTNMDHMDQVDALADSMRTHGYDERRADHPIEVLTHKGDGAVLEGHHRVWAAHYAGITHLPVQVKDGSHQAALSAALDWMQAHVAAMAYLDARVAAEGYAAPVVKGGVLHHEGGPEWHHGTPHAFKSFDEEPEEDEDDWDDGGERQPEHWNTHLGTHWTSHQPTAAKFAKGLYGNDLGTKAGTVHTAHLGITKPKHYGVESDMDHEAFHHAWEHHEAHDPDDVHPNICHDDKCYGFESHEHGDPVDKKVKAHYADSVGGAGRWLTTHPDSPTIADGFQRRLTAAGHDGVTYGNEVEGPKGHPCAISFDPKQIRPVRQTHVGTTAAAHPAGHLHIPDHLFRFSPDDENECGSHHLEITGGPAQDSFIHWRSSHGELGNIGVRPEHRRRGVATQLWNKANELASQHNLTPPHHSDVRSEDGEEWAKKISPDAVPKRFDTYDPDENWAPPKTAVTHDFYNSPADPLEGLKSQYPRVHVLPKGEAGFFMTPEGHMHHIGNEHDVAAAALLGRTHPEHDEGPSSMEPGWKDHAGDFMKKTGSVRLRSTEREVMAVAPPQGLTRAQHKALAGEADGRNVSFSVLDAPHTYKQLQSPEPRDVTKALRPHVMAAKVAIEQGVWYHGTPDDRHLPGASYGLHVGTEEAARQALHARIGEPAEGSWDGTREYGKTLLKGQTHGVGINADHPVGTTYYPKPATYHAPSPHGDGPPLSAEERQPGKHYNARGATYSSGAPVPMDARPSVFPVRITGPMTNTPHTPHEDFKANGYMKAAITRGRAKNGYYYTNQGEDEGSISAVVPSHRHLQRLDGKQIAAVLTAGNTEENKVEHVPVHALLPLREYDRETTPKWGHGDPTLDDLTEDIKANGIKSPLIITYGKDDRRAKIGEGNTRLAAAQRLGITHVPARVVRVSKVPDGAKVPGHKVEYDSGGYERHVNGDLKPSEIGLPVKATTTSAVAFMVSLAEVDLADTEAGMDEVKAACKKTKHTHSGLAIKAADSGRVLLTQRTPADDDDEGTYGRWEFPGGSIDDDDEDCYASAVREFHEETGLTLPEGHQVAGCFENGTYLGIIVRVPHEAWTTDADLLAFETMGIGWFLPEHIEGADFGRETMEKKTDWDLVKEAMSDRSEYGGGHSPGVDGPPVHNLLASGPDGESIAPHDIYTHMHYYTDGNDGPDQESMTAIRQAKHDRPVQRRPAKDNADWRAKGHDFPDTEEESEEGHAKRVQRRADGEHTVTVYRAAPKGIKTLNTGDWVTLSPSYARGHARHHDDPTKDSPVYKVKVPAKHVRWAGDSLNEFGYSGPEVKHQVHYRGGRNTPKVEPRTAAVRKAPAGHQVLYHGTTSWHSPDIDGGGIKGNDMGMVYATSDPDRAEAWARKRVRDHDDGVYRHSPMVVQFHGHEDDITGGARAGEFIHHGPVPGKHVMDIWEADEEPNDHDRKMFGTAAFGDTPEDQKRLKDIADLMSGPSTSGQGIYGDHGRDRDQGYGGYIQQSRGGGLHIDGKPLKKLYRVVHPKEWEDAQREGYLQSKAGSGGYTRASAKPDERWRNGSMDQLEVGSRGHTLEIDVHPDDKWHASAEGYAATHAKIPLSRVRKVGSQREAAGPPRYVHGTDAVLKPGDIIHPASAGKGRRNTGNDVAGYDSGRVYMHDRDHYDYTETAAKQHGAHVYGVEPIGKVGKDPEVEHWKKHYPAHPDQAREEFGLDDGEEWSEDLLGGLSSVTAPAARVVSYEHAGWNGGWKGEKNGVRTAILHTTEDVENENSTSMDPTDFKAHGVDPKKAKWRVEQVPLSSVHERHLYPKAEHYLDPKMEPEDRRMRDMIGEVDELPPSAMIHRDGKYHILDGAHRLAAHEHLGRTTMPAYVTDSPLSQARTAILHGPDDIPPKPGTTPIPEGHVRLWHYTGTQNLPSIREHGLLNAHARGDGGTGPSEPSAGVWASTTPPSDSALHNHNYVEFHAHPSQITQRAESPGHADPVEWAKGDHHVIMHGDVHPHQIAAIHEPWHTGYHYLKDDYSSEVKKGEYDWVHDDPGTEAQYGKAVRRIKSEAALDSALAWLTIAAVVPPGWTDEHQAHTDRDQAYAIHGSHHTTGGRVLHGHPARHEAAVGDEEWEHRWASPESGADVPDFVSRGAAAYRAKQGLPEPKRSSVDVVAHKATSKRIAHAYDSMPADDPKAHPAYRAMAHEVGKQFHHLTSPVESGGMGVKVEVVDHDPYPSHHHLVQDLAQNHRIKVLSTKTTGPHPLFTNEENDQFRAVHDVFGHAGTGRPFDRHGEEAAWSEHASMFSAGARAALTTETRGQNASLINNGKFAPQKVGLLPSEFHDDSAVAGVHRRALAHAAAFLQRAIGWLDGRMTSDPALRKVPVPCAP